MTEGSATLTPFRLRTAFVERVWGRRDLRPWYEHEAAQPVGEAWLTGEQCTVDDGPLQGRSFAEVQKQFGATLLGESPEFPLLVKILFPSEKLSVQVHPDDAQAEELGDGARAKTECWYVLQAEADASVALGFQPEVSMSDVHAALGRPEFEGMLQTLPVHAGDMIYVQAGTVHAIGPGMVLLEIQQTSDTTFRLYDYGRPRELHLEKGGKVIKFQHASGKVQPTVADGLANLISVKHFSVDRMEIRASEAEKLMTAGRPECLVLLEGEGCVCVGLERTMLQKGAAVVVPACCERYALEGSCTVVRARVPAD